MQGKWILVLIILTGVLLAGCQAEEAMKPELTRIVYTSAAGTILPELQWFESFTITPGRVTLTRSGRTADTQVNAGSWDIAVEQQATADLFAALHGVNCAALRRVEPQDAPDGGGTESYTLGYADGGECELLFDPGVTYPTSEAVTAPVQSFLQGLALPAGSDRYKLP